MTASLGMQSRQKCSPSLMGLEWHLKRVGKRAVHWSWLHPVFHNSQELSLRAFTLSPELRVKISVSPLHGGELRMGWGWKGRRKLGVREGVNIHTDEDTAWGVTREDCPISEWNWKPLQVGWVFSPRCRGEPWGSQELAWALPVRVGSVNTRGARGTGGLVGELSESRLLMKLMNLDKASVEKRGWRVETWRGRGWILHCNLRKERSRKRRPGGHLQSFCRAR